MTTDKRKKVALDPKRAERLRGLAVAMALDRLHEFPLADLEVIAALKDFAEVLEGKQGKDGRPRTRYQREETFLQLSCLYFHEQSENWKKKKGRPEARREVATLTGWRLPKLTAGYTTREARFAAELASKSPNDLDIRKMLVKLSVPAERQEAVAAAIGLRTK